MRMRMIFAIFGLVMTLKKTHLGSIKEKFGNDCHFFQRPKLPKIVHITERFYAGHPIRPFPYNIQGVSFIKIGFEFNGFPH